MGSQWSHMVVRVTAQKSTYTIHKLPNLLKMADSFYPELTLDYKTSLSSPTNTGAWFVSSAHVDPRVLHANVWDHQVPCAEYLDSLHTNWTAVCSGKRERKSSWEGWERIYIWQQKRTTWAYVQCATYSCYVRVCTTVTIREGLRKTL